MGEKYEAYNLLDSCKGGDYGSNALHFIMEAYRKNESNEVAAASRISGLKDATFKQVNADVATGDGGHYLGEKRDNENKPVSKEDQWANVICPATGL